jgi:hypothetical protein
LSINSFISREPEGKLLQPLLAALQGRDAHEAGGARPWLALHVFDRAIAYGNDLPARAPEGVYLVEDRLLDNVGLEEDESTIALGGQRAIGDEQFIQDIEFA